MFLETLCGLSYLHEYDIVHRDIKPDNILIDEGNGQLLFRISDFNASKELKGTRMSKFMGTHVYMAPELTGHFDLEL